MNLKLQLRELAARSQRVVELARGDFAIPALVSRGLMPRAALTTPHIESSLKGNFGAARRQVRDEVSRRGWKPYSPEDVEYQIAAQRR